MTLHIIQSSSTIPYENLALEEYLLDHVGKEEVILYLWQNKKTVVIGKNQNPWRECKLEELKEDGGYLARRLSGGGAVFQDLGNLNFTFLAQKGNYNLDKQLQVIIEAVAKLGLVAEKSGRNDILVQEKKFSGNAFYQRGNNCYHHGTILINANMEDMGRYLNVSQAKLKSKGVTSVKSRVTNLSQLNPEITVNTMKSALIEAFSQVYNNPVNEYVLADKVEYTTMVSRYSDFHWVYGRKIPFNCSYSHKFDWGEVVIEFYVEAGKVKDVKVWTDALEELLSEKIENRLINTVFLKEDMIKSLGDLGYIMEEIFNV